ncbi:single-stranded-DNA-specific exonuclease RecJ [Thalassobacillus sp. CUG 92003]|uniref:single-stranded-DNA-specific exonuclease RecJ n=1 Tax=Thalassobacillus sp. CUG 92003 TaxID=2736641 RepID=UPI0015E65AA6|nr:single-stranded-DNA-specific exonuclease RecJ [Thalassobacillus sp. CUG 92003]
MLASKMKWNFTYNQASKDESDKQQMGQIADRLLHMRNVKDQSAVNRFIKPSLDDLHDPFLISDMEKAVNRIHKAIENDEKLLVFGDYDADGVCSTAVMMEALMDAGADCDFYIPNRFTEGYGPNEPAFQSAKDAGVSVIITVDTGIAAIDEANAAREMGIDLIITDHHEVQEELPDAFAIVHPKTSPQYPFKELAGVGVAFKFAHALHGRLPEELLEFVAVGTIADLVPLQEENRNLVWHGLKKINLSTRPGIQALKRVAGVEDAIDEEAIGFMLAPRLNAVGRLQSADPAVDLLLSKNAEESLNVAQMIDELNNERKNMVQSIAQEAEQMLMSEGIEDNQYAIVVAKEGWNPGVLGIVASKLVNRFDRPAIVLGIDAETGVAKGSARSIEAFDLFSNCMKLKHLFTQFGGHAQAAGMTLPVGNIAEVRKQLNELADALLEPEDFKQSLQVDMSLDIASVDLSQLEEINQLRPFGMGNPKPIFHLEQAPKEIRRIGSKQNHLKFQFQKEGRKLDGIAFGFGDVYPAISPHANLQAVGELNVNEWNGRRNVQIMIKDLKIDEWQLFDYRGSKHIHKQIDIPDKENHIAVSFRNNSSALPLQVFQPEELYGLQHVDGLWVVDLPYNLDAFAQVVRQVQPDKLMACYRVEDGAFLNTIPKREHFKWFYAMLKKKETFDMKTDGEILAARSGWNHDLVEFVTQVFFELEFVRIENGLVSLNTSPSKKELSESLLYQEKFEQLQIEQTLYYSSFPELKQWLDQYILEQRDAVKEEVANGL